MILEYKGLVLMQDDDNEIDIYKDNKLLIHETNKKRCSLRELHEEIDKYLEERDNNNQDILIKTKKISF